MTSLLSLAERNAIAKIEALRKSAEAPAAVCAEMVAANPRINYEEGTEKAERYQNARRDVFLAQCEACVIVRKRNTPAVCAVYDSFVRAA